LGSSNRMRVPRTSLAFASVFSKTYFQVADNNVEVNLNDLNGDGIYAPLENSGDYLKVNTETAGSYVTITNAGDGTFTLNIDGTETTGVVEGTTGTHDGFRYYVGSGSGEPTAEPICFVKGTMIPMADGSKKPIEEIKVGDEIRTEKGPSRVIASKHWNVVVDEKSIPYKVADGVLVSPKHKVKKNGKVFHAKDVGVK